jgi:hypothetical protein
VVEIGDFVRGRILDVVRGPVERFQIVEGVVLATEGYDGTLLVATVGGHRVLLAPDVVKVPLVIDEGAKALVRQVIEGGLLDV